ncbi:MAG: hypothetical protein WEC14_04605 [Chloroflexota bacterium]
MDEQAVRDHAQGHIDALVAGDVDRAIQDLSQELQRSIGEIMAMLPLPLTSADVESVSMGGSSYTAVLHLVGESTEARLETRWKDRDGRPTIIEASLVHEAPTAIPDAEDDDSEHA